MRERAFADKTDGHGISGAWFLDTRCKFGGYVLCLLFANACDQCVKLPKTARQPAKSPSKGKKSESVEEEPLSDYHKGLVHDIALKAHLQRVHELLRLPASAFISTDTIEDSDQTQVFHQIVSGPLFPYANLPPRL